MERHFFALQRFTALAMAPFVLVHLFVILYAVRGGLTVGEILSRTQGSWLWISFYGLFVLCSAVHVPIGLRNVLVEWARVPRGAATLLCYVLMVVFAVLGMRAVLSVGGLA